MPYRIAINGMGRIGRCVLRAFYESIDYPQVRIVALNDVADIGTLAHLIRYDSTHGRFLGSVDQDEQSLCINGDQVLVFNEEQHQNLPWSELDIDLVMECTGTFSDRTGASVHLEAGAKKVLFSQPADSDVDATVVYGINHQKLTGKETILSNASCTTNAIIPVIQCLDEALGVQNGVITTIHSAMNDQPVIDAFHHSDLRKTRSAIQSIIPVETHIARGIGRVLPHLDGRFEAQAMRVPTVNVSAIDLAVVVTKSCSVESVNELVKKKSQQLLPNIMGYTDEPLASCDFNHDPRSAIVDLSFTRVSGGYLVKILTWFDNEWAYANRMLDVAQYLYSIGKR
ncbi:MAG: type I glyceraldehyde-3-phosphate dehydrogenase [Gammaproteobacteria bacterium]|nr:type I glyceraldehyde-3-phosphate dehydrogenase [Gammaproteobacteria bacterium]